MRVLGLFAKRPEPGQVKTRLAAATSPAWAARAATAFLHDTLHRLSTVNAHRLLPFDPPDAAPFFVELVGERFALVARARGGLGQRVCGSVQGKFRWGATAVVLVGPASATLRVEYVERAFAELERAPIVLGPAPDGGYSLIGCVPPFPP